MSRLPPRRQLEIRSATPEDAGDVLALWQRSLDEGAPKSRAAPVEVSPERLAEVLADPDVEVLLARMADRAVAFAVMRLTPLNVFTGSTALCLDEFYVLSAERRHGVGRAILGHVATRAERLGAEQIIAGVPPWSKDAQRYFAKLGFAPVMVRRAATPAALRRRLAGADGKRGTLENLLSRRRSLRARSRRQRGSDEDVLVG